MKTQTIHSILFILFFGVVNAQDSNNPLIIENLFTGGVSPISGTPLHMPLFVRWEGVTDYNFSIDWENNGMPKKYKKVNGIVTEGNTDNIGTNADSFYHLFDSVGLKIIKIYGPNFPGLNYRISNDNNRSKLRRIISWGDVTWQDMQEAFYRCNNLTIENDAGCASNI